MERTVALKKLGKLLGNKLGYRIKAKAPTPEERAGAKAALAPARAERDRLKEQRDTRHREILAADAEYQRLQSEARAAVERVEKLSGTSSHYKITVGLDLGWAFEVKAEGDSWEDVIDKLSARTSAEKIIDRVTA